MHVKLRKLFNYFQLLDEMAVLATILFKDKFGIRERSLVTIEFNKVSYYFLEINTIFVCIWLYFDRVKHPIKIIFTLFIFRGKALGKCEPLAWELGKNGFKFI